MTEPKTPLENALDVLVYAPLGLALTAAEELPKLAEKGRTRVNSQLMVAKMVGQFAVAQGRKEIERRLTPTARSAAPAAPDAAPSHPPAPPPRAAPTASGNGQVDDRDSLAVAPAPAGGAQSEPDFPRARPSGDSLAIPGYDSLSASQVVQRLAGLSSEELAAVGVYEEAHRARRTVLTRVRQLQNSSQ